MWDLRSSTRDRTHALLQWKHRVLADGLPGKSLQKYVCLNFSSVQSLSHVQLFMTPWTTASQNFLSITSSQNLPKLMSIDLVMPSNHLTLCHPLLLLPSIFPSTRVFSNELALWIRWPKYWSFASASVLAMNIQDSFPLGLTGLIYCISYQDIRRKSSFKVQAEEDTCSVRLINKFE